VSQTNNTINKSRDFSKEAIYLHTDSRNFIARMGEIFRVLGENKLVAGTTTFNCDMAATDSLRTERTNG